MEEKLISRNKVLQSSHC